MRVPAGLLVATLALQVGTADVASAQFAEPCAVACALTLGVTGVATATGAVVAIGRLSGGLASSETGVWIGGASLVLVVGGGMALSGDGERQRDAVYGAAIGSALSSVVWLGVAAATDRRDRGRMLAATLIGAATGALIGGVYGAQFSLGL